jgi:hypothetical protein
MPGENLLCFTCNDLYIKMGLNNWIYLIYTLIKKQYYEIFKKI